MQIDVSRFRAAFYVEAEEHLEHMEAALLQLEEGPGDPELLNTIFRAAHSIKGASLTFGIEEVGKFTHVLENLLDRLRDGKLATSSELIELLLSSIDVLEGLIANSRDGAPMPEQLDAIFTQLQIANGDSRSAPAPSQATADVAANESGVASYRIEFRPSREFFKFGQDALLLVRELAEIGQIQHVRIDASAMPALAEMKPDECYTAWSLELTTAQPLRSVEDVFMFLDDGSHLHIQPMATTAPAEKAETAAPNPLLPQRPHKSAQTRQHKLKIQPLPTSKKLPLPHAATRTKRCEWIDAAWMNSSTRSVNWSSVPRWWSKNYWESTAGWRSIR